MTSFVDLALQIDRLMRRIHADVHPQAEQFDYEKVGPLGGMALLAIGEAEPAPMQKVISKLGRDKSQITRLIQNLERKGLIEKDCGQVDGRELVLRLTPRGRRQLDSIQSVLADVVENIFAPLSKTETENFSQLLDRVLDASP